MGCRCGSFGSRIAPLKKISVNIRFFTRITEDNLTSKQRKKVHRYVDGQLGYKVVCGGVSCILEFEAYHYHSEPTDPGSTVPNHAEQTQNQIVPNGTLPPETSSNGIAVEGGIHQDANDVATEHSRNDDERSLQNSGEPHLRHVIADVEPTPVSTSNNITSSGDTNSISSAVYSTPPTTRPGNMGGNAHSLEIATAVPETTNTTSQPSTSDTKSLGKNDSSWTNENEPDNDVI